MNKSPLSDRDFPFIEDGSAGVLSGLAGAELFVTGGTGFVGKWLLEMFTRANDRLGLGARAYVLSRNPEAFRAGFPWIACHPSVRLIEGDVTTFEPPVMTFTHVIHGAAEVRRDEIESAPQKAFETIAEGTRRVLHATAERSGAKVLLISSGAVYGTQPAGLERIPESYHGAPDVAAAASAYGEGKRVSELYAGFLSRAGANIVTARCFAFVGPYMPVGGNFAVSDFLANARRKEVINVKGDGSARRSYMYASDLSRWLLTILLNGRSGESYNVGSEHSVSVAELAERIRVISGSPEVRIEGARKHDRVGEQYVPDTSKARNELGLRETVDLDGAIRRTLAYHQTTSET